MHEIIGIAGASGSGKSKFSRALRANVGDSYLARSFRDPEAIKMGDIEYSDAICGIANKWFSHLPMAMSSNGIHDGTTLASLPNTRLITVANTWINALSEKILHNKNDSPLLGFQLQPDGEVSPLNISLLNYMRQFSSLPMPPIDNRNHLGNKYYHLPVLRWLSKQISASNPNYWNDEVSQQIHTVIDSGAPSLVTVSGIRFPSNSDLIHSMGGTVVEIRYPNSHNTTSAQSEEIDVKPDIVVLNTGTFEQVSRAAEVVIDGITEHGIDPEMPRVIFTRDLYTAI